MKTFESRDAAHGITPSLWEERIFLGEERIFLGEERIPRREARIPVAIRSAIWTRMEGLSDQDGYDLIWTAVNNGVRCAVCTIFGYCVMDASDGRLFNEENEVQHFLRSRLVGFESYVETNGFHLANSHSPGALIKINVVDGDDVSRLIATAQREGISYGVRQPAH